METVLPEIDSGVLVTGAGRGLSASQALAERDMTAAAPTDVGRGWRPGTTRWPDA